MPSKEIETLVRQLRSRKARKAGWEVKVTRGTHYEVTFQGERVAMLAGTGGRGRGIQNARAELKRAGWMADQ